VQQKLDSVMLNKVIVEDNIECAFPNVEISLRLFLEHSDCTPCFRADNSVNRLFTYNLDNRYNANLQLAIQFFNVI
jgi:hypothetical protein